LERAAGTGPFLLAGDCGPMDRANKCRDDILSLFTGQRAPDEISRCGSMRGSERGSDGYGQA
jgi:hypothetical protein